VQYAEIARAIARAEAIAGHRLYFSICNWGVQSPWTWAPNIGGLDSDIWRTGGDIVDPIVAGTKNASRKAQFKEVLREFDQAQHPEAQHTGAYNDPDMMVVGMPGLDDAQNRAHMSLWAISGGPLLVGADLTKLSAADLATLTNPDVVRIDQDPLGLQCIKVAECGPGLEVWAKPLSDPGKYAVLLLNRSASPAPIAVRWSDLGLDEGKAAVRDTLAQRDVGEFSSSYSATVPAADAILLIVQGKETPGKTYPPENAEKAQQFTHVASKFPIARIRISYSNPDKSPRFAELRVNGRTAMKIAFPPTGADLAGAISIESRLDTGEANNILIFSTPNGSAPVIKAISVQ
jgi:hypothetical protein